MKDNPSITVRGVEYTRQDIISDIRAIQEEFPDRVVTRNLFRQHTNIPESAWTGIFGTFIELQRQAEIKPTRLGMKIANTIAKEASEDVMRKVSLERFDYADRYTRDSMKKIKTLIGVSDMHDIECDPFLMRVYEDSVRRIEPDYISLAGDIFDCPDFGKYYVDPRGVRLKPRMDAGKDIVRRSREAAPNATIDLIEGNHEGRVLRYMQEKCPVMIELLAEYHGMDMKKLFGLTEFEINYIANADLSIYDEKTRERAIIEQNYKVYEQSLAVTHEPQVSGLKMPGINGHHHSHEVETHYTFDRGSYQWHQLGGGHIRAASYCNGEKWNNGFMIAHIYVPNRSVTFSYVDVGPVHAEVGGKFYFRRPEEVYPELEKEYKRRGQELKLIEHDES